MQTNMDPIESSIKTSINVEHKLSDTWSLWAHLPHNTDWSNKSYINIADVNTVENTIAITEVLPDVLIENCMLFFMRQGIIPTWEDPRNRKGGSFSYKVSNKNVQRTWRDLTYVVVGNTVSNKPEFVNSVSGITISPKKNFCIIKIWMADCNNQNPSDVTTLIKDITPVGCIFKKHAPEY